MGSPVSRLSSIFGNSAIFEVMYVSIFRASPAEPAPSAQRDIDLRARAWFGARLLPSRPSTFTRTPEKGLGDDLGRRFLKREGALIHYPGACVHFSLQPVPAPNEIDAALEYTPLSNSSRTKLRAEINIVAAASIRSYTVYNYYFHLGSPL